MQWKAMTMTTMLMCCKMGNCPMTKIKCEGGRGRAEKYHDKEERNRMGRQSPEVSVIQQRGGWELGGEMMEC